MKKDKIKIDYLIVAPLNTLGQIEYYNERKKMLNELGYSCKILTLKEHPFYKHLIKHLILPFYYDLLTQGLYYRFAINNILRKYQPKIIEFQNNTVILQKNNIFRKYKTIISFDYPSLLKIPWYGFLIKFLEMNKLKKANIIIGRSQFALNKLKKYIPNSIFISHSIKSYKKKIAFGKKNFILYYCSPKQPHEKGLDIAINFWKEYSKKYKFLILKIVGITKEDSIKYLCLRRIRLPERITFLGTIKKEKYLEEVKKSYFMINTSRVEESPRSLLECLSLGKIVFTTPTTGPKDLFGELDEKLVSKNFKPIKLIKLIENANKEYDIQLDKYLYYNNKKILLKIVKQLINKKFIQGRFLIF